MTSMLGRLLAQQRRDVGMSHATSAERPCLETGRTLTRREPSRHEGDRRVPRKAMIAALANVLAL